VYLSNYFAAKNRKKLQEHDITHVLVCAQELPCAFPSELAYKQLKIADNPSQILPLKDGVAFVIAAGEEGGRVLVHCAAGGSRSASIVLAWVMQVQSISFDQAIAQVREKRWVEPNIGFETQLRAFEQHSTGNIELDG
jgi:protein-tyrosine phosphatase